MRGELWQKIKGSWINSFLFSCFLLLIFILLFYLANLDLQSDDKKVSLVNSPSTEEGDLELEKRMGGVTWSSLSYAKWAERYDLGLGAEKYDGDPDKDGLPNFQEYVHGTDPRSADTDGDTYFDKDEIANGYDPDALKSTDRPAVEIFISKINAAAPMIWSQGENEKEVMQDLEKGVSHFAKTAAPGQIGNAIISGHSSNYIWAKGDYNHVFKNLNDLEKNDEITVQTIQKNGRVIIYRYAVIGKYIDAPDDERIFETTNKSILTLATCWPLGTNFKRLVIKAELIK